MGIRDPFGAPVDAFMALELKEGAIEGAGGVVDILMSSSEFEKEKTGFKK